MASLIQRNEVKKVGMTRPYPLEWVLVPYPPKFKLPTLHTYNGKNFLTSIFITFGLNLVM